MANLSRSKSSLDARRSGQMRSGGSVDSTPWAEVKRIQRKLREFDGFDEEDLPSPKRRLFAVQSGEMRNGAHLHEPMQRMDVDRKQEILRRDDEFDAEDLLNPNTRDPPRPVNRHVNLRLPRRQISNDDGCRCGEIDIDRIFDRGGPEVRLCNLDHAMVCHYCPMCFLICQLAHKLYGSEFSSRPDLSDYDCRIKRAIATQDEFPLRMSAGAFARILLVIRHNARLNHARGSGTTFTLDRVGLGRTPRPNYYDSPFLFRRPIRGAFDSKLLCGWLRDSDRSEALKDEASSNQQAASFRQVLASGKFRVVDVIDNRIVTITEPVRFLALSYVWGKSMTNYAAAANSSINLNSGAASSDEVQWSEVPRTLRDAATLTRDIGERYLWIDSLCIDQSSAEEKELLISQMASIYANAYLTIVAANGKDANAGLSRLDYNPSAEERPTSMLAGGYAISLLLTRPDSKRAIISSYWSSRGWTLQERLMSKRCVFFTEEQVYFQDAEVLASEAYGIWRPLDSTASKKHAHNNESFDTVGDLYFRILEKKGLGLAQYDQAICEYSKRTLTHTGDRFDAFMGISEFFQPPGLPMDHISALNALPLKYFTNALRWKHYAWNKPARRIRSDARKSRALPSWSWVGWEGEVCGPFHFDPFANTAAVIDGANILCKICDAPADFSPKLCQVSRPAAVTLHLYAKSIPCLVCPSDDGDELTIALITEDTSDCPQWLDRSIKLDEKPQHNWTFELVLMRRELLNGHNDFWLLRIDQPFSERLAFVEATWSEGNLYPYLKENYFRVR